jgi:hypothetical protein
MSTIANKVGMSNQGDSRNRFWMVMVLLVEALLDEPPLPHFGAPDRL